MGSCIDLLRATYRTGPPKHTQLVPHLSIYDSPLYYPRDPPFEEYTLHVDFLLFLHMRWGDDPFLSSGDKLHHISHFETKAEHTTDTGGAEN